MADADRMASLTPHQRRVSFAALIAILLLVGTGSQIVALPLNRIIELRYCQDFYAKSDPSRIGPGGFVPEHLCKVDEVQTKLGWLSGIYQTVALAIDLAVTLPMGYVADRIGARTAMLLNVAATGVILLWILAVGYFRELFSIVMIVAGPILAAWGGGQCVLKSTTLTLLADIARDDAQRTVFLAYVTSVNYITMFFTPALAGVLMERSLWLPLWLGVACTALALPLLTLIRCSRTHDRESRRSKGLDEVHEVEPLLTEADESGPATTAHAYPRGHPIGDLINGYIKLIKSSRNFQLLLSATCLSGFASSTSPLLIRYISKRYGWAYSKIGYLFTFKAAVNVFLLSICVPAFTEFALRRPNASAAWAELMGTRATLVASVLGAILIASSVNMAMLVPSICIYAIGSALPVFEYSLARPSAVDTVSPENESTVFSLMVLLNSLGNVAGAPLMTLLWVKGIEVGGAGLGLPYFASAAVYSAAIVVAVLIRVK